MFMDSTTSVDAVLSALARDFSTRAAEHDAKADFAFENIRALHEAGLLALVLPKERGGRSGGLREAEHSVNRIATGDAATALILAQQHLFLKHIEFSPTCAVSLREKIFSSAVEEGGLGNLLRVEPDLGSPARGGLPATVARKVDGGWRITGRKIYSTGAPGLRWLAIWARTEDDLPLVGTWIVPNNAEGLRIEETWDHAGMRASASHDVVLDDVFVPQDHASDIRKPEGWAATDPLREAWLPILFATVYDGVAQAARQWFIEFLKTRTPSNLGAPLATLARMQDAVGQIDALLYQNRILLRDITTRTDAGDVPSFQDTSFVKLAICDNAIAAVEKAVEMSGNPGLSRANPLERHYRDVLCARVHSPQADSVLLAAGRQSLGILPERHA